jgi:hypothetical protein
LDSKHSNLCSAHIDADAVNCCRLFRHIIADLGAGIKQTCREKRYRIEKRMGNRDRPEIARFPIQDNSFFIASCFLTFMALSVFCASRPGCAGDGCVHSRPRCLLFAQCRLLI